MILKSVTIYVYNSLVVGSGERLELINKMTALLINNCKGFIKKHVMLKAAVQALKVRAGVFSLPSYIYTLILFTIHIYNAEHPKKIMNENIFFL